MSNEALLCLWLVIALFSVQVGLGVVLLLSDTDPIERIRQALTRDRR